MARRHPGRLRRSRGSAAAIKFIPYPVVTGFTSGIAVIIFSSQIKDLLGLDMGAVPAEFVEKWAAYARHIDSVNLAAVARGRRHARHHLSLWPRVNRADPGAVRRAARHHGAGAAARAAGRDDRHPLRRDRAGAAAPVAAAACRFAHGARRSSGRRSPSRCSARIESLLSAVVADGMIGGRHRSNMELVAQGVANIVSPLFGGIPATGAIARTATNVKNGGRTPVAGIVHALTLLLITLFFGRWAALIPLAALAAILVVVAYHMSEWRTFRAELRAPKSDVAVLLTTFVLTVLVDLTVAIEVGMVLAAFLFMRRMAEVTNVSVLDARARRERRRGGPGPQRGPAPARCRPGVEVYEINGPFFFGAAEKFKDTLAELAADAQGAHHPHAERAGDRLDRAARPARRGRPVRRAGTRVLLSDVHAQPMLALQRSALADELPEDDLVGNIDDALNVARAHLGLAPVARAAFAIPTVAREDRRRQPRPPG